MASSQLLFFCAISQLNTKVFSNHMSLIVIGRLVPFSMFVGNFCLQKYRMPQVEGDSDSDVPEDISFQTARDDALSSLKGERTVSV